MGWRERENAEKDEHSTEQSVGSLGDSNRVQCEWSPEGEDDQISRKKQELDGTEPC